MAFAIGDDYRLYVQIPASPNAFRHGLAGYLDCLLPSLIGT